jgi:RND family efflux transporter MFP subunit
MTAERKVGGGRLVLAVVAIAALLAVAAAVTLAGRRAEFRALERETDAQTILTVAVIHPLAQGANEDLVLPSTLQAFVESPIYARTNGYLKKWYVDIGGRVEAGAPLADIDTPEVDQELAAARASRDQISATLDLAKSTAERYGALQKSDSVSQQEVDEKKSLYTQAVANLAAATANVQRLEQLEAFKHVYAPFAGVVTRRNVDVGTLVNAGNGGAAQQLFHLAQTDPMRVYVQVPEGAAPSVRAGVAATLDITQFPGEVFTGQVVRTSGSIDPSTRTLQTEVDVPNRQGRLLPGGFAQVHLKVGGAQRLQVPVNALLFRAEGLRAAVVDANHRVQLRPLTIGRDFGTSLEVLQGLSPNDWIVINPPDSLETNQEVRVQTPPAPAGPAVQAGKTGGRP